MFSSLVVVATAMFIGNGRGAGELRIETLGDPTQVRVVAIVSPVSKDESSQGNQQAAKGRLRFSLVDEKGEIGPAVFGKYQWKDNSLVFTPKYGLARGERYRAFLLRPNGKTLTRDYRVPSLTAKQPTVVERIDPTSDVVPANLLKFYLTFSRPMREGREIFDLIQILDSKGRPIPDAWRRTELWTPDARRFTLWIHPGRVKQGVNLREDEGPVLYPGRRYTLRILGKLRDADGQPLGQDVVKHFRTTAEDRQALMPLKWKLHPPTANSRNPLRVEFGEPLDHAMLFRLLRVRDAKGKFIVGEVRSEKSDSSWRFHPAEPWGPGEHELVISELLEDLAGNTAVRPFDTDLSKPLPRLPALTLSFRPARQERKANGDGN